MSKDSQAVNKTPVKRKRSVIITFIGTIASIILILVTLEVSRRNTYQFVTSQKRYIIALEAAILATFIIEMLGRLIRFVLPAPHMVEQAASLHLIVRIIGYVIALICVVSILASNATLGISIGAIAGIIIAFATQNALGGVIAAVIILSTRMVHVGEVITVNQITGTVSEINLVHTVLSIEEDVIFVPNSLVISSIIRRKKRDSDKNASVRDW